MSRGMYRTSHLALASILLIFFRSTRGVQIQIIPGGELGEKTEYYRPRSLFWERCTFRAGHGNRYWHLPGWYYRAPYTPIPLPCAEGEWDIVGLHTYEMAQQPPELQGTRELESRIVGEWPLKWPRMHNNNG